MLLESFLVNETTGSFSRRQQLFFKYTYLVLIDLVVLNFFNEFWSYLHIANFGISLLTAILLQVLLHATMLVEHRVASYFKKKSGASARILRGLSTWGILIVSKLVILWAINFLFGSDVLFGGPYHGIVAFIAVVIVIIIAEQVCLWIYKMLA